MHTNEYGIVFLTEKECINALYSGKIDSLKNVFLDNISSEKFNLSVEHNKDNFEKLKIYKNINLDIKKFDELNQNQWFMPKDYFPNLIEYLYNSCSTDIEKNRVSEELELFVQYNMLDLLFYLKYLIDTMRKNNIVWGVGRGSSVASFVLYLIGVHKVNSIQYNLDIHEFLK